MGLRISGRKDHSGVGKETGTGRRIAQDEGRLWTCGSRMKIQWKL